MSSNKKLMVNDVMMKPDSFPVLDSRTLLKEALEAMSRSHLGIACVVDEKFKLLGIITDGDIRRKLLNVQKPFSAFFADDVLIHTVREPITVKPTTSLVESVELMGEQQIWDLPVVDDNNILLGLLHLHPAIKAVLDSNS